MPIAFLTGFDNTRPLTKKAQNEAEMLDSLLDFRIDNIIDPVFTVLLCVLCEFTVRLCFHITSSVTVQTRFCVLF